MFHSGVILGRVVAWFFRIGMVAVIAYFLLTAYVGYRLGADLYEAKANPFVGFASNVAGREFTEQYAINKANVPDYITDSPTFWWALRATE